MNSFMSWIGGKKSLRELIVGLFPLYYEPSEDAARRRSHLRTQ